LAFLFYTVLYLIDESYRQIRLKRGTRKGFFRDVLCLTKFILFDSWQHLIDFMLSDKDFSRLRRVNPVINVFKHSLIEAGLAMEVRKKIKKHPIKGVLKNSN
jgi:hypothetical protein